MITFYTDPHLGLARTSNTTTSSALKLREALYRQALSIAKGPGPAICLGDLLDRFSNPEDVQREALNVLLHTRLTLAGNHDVVNQADKVGTLRFLSEVAEIANANSECVFAEEFGEPRAYQLRLLQENAVLYCVPHVAGQEVFEQSLDLAQEKAKDEAPVGTNPDDYNCIRILLLHCNYDMPEERLTETSLNLSPGRALKLMSAFHYVMLGHEHGPAEHFNGRLVILGNIHPTGMSDISDKRIAHLENGKLRFEKVWDASTGYEVLDCGNLPDRTQASFVRIKGNVVAGDMLELTKAVAAMWKRSPQLYCVRMDVSLPTLSGADQRSAQRSLSQLPDLIRKELESVPDLRDLWDRLLEQEVEQGERQDA